MGANGTLPLAKRRRPCPPIQGPPPPTLASRELALPRPAGWLDRSHPTYSHPPHPPFPYRGSVLHSLPSL
eukprot:8949654-Pyramimonas_sp.AAC.1